MEEDKLVDQPSIIAISVRYGLMLALCELALFFLIITTGGNPFEDDIRSWLGTIFSIASVILAHKSYKDKGDGFMSYGEGLRIGFLSIMISILVSGIFIYFYISAYNTDLLDKIWSEAEKGIEESGQGENAEIAIRWAKKLFWVFYFLGRTIGALIIALIVSIFTQKKNPNPFTT